MQGGDWTLGKPTPTQQIGLAPLRVIRPQVTINPLLTPCARISAKALGAQTPASAGVFFFMDEKMRTIAYVDGQNLFFSCLKGTPYKWLDLEKLVRGVLMTEVPESELIAVKYFTSPIKGAFARRGQASTDAQAEYVRALRANPRVTVREGRFSADAVYALMHAVPPDRRNRVRVWRLEEKETDVSLAMAMYQDARNDTVDQIVLISNDSDMVPALRMIRSDTRVQIGVVLPLPRPRRGSANARRPSGGLAGQADWIRVHICVDELATAQLPPVVATGRRAARRPEHW